MTNKPIGEVIAEIKSAAGKATETHWIVADEDRSDGDDAIVTCELRQGMIEIAKIQGGGSESGYDDEFADQQRANAAFIALMCPENTLLLIDHIAALEQQNAELSRWREEYQGKLNAEHVRVGGQYQSGIAELNQQLAAERADNVSKTDLLKRLAKARPGGAYFRKWDGEISAVLSADVKVEGE